MEAYTMKYFGIDLNEKSTINEIGYEGIPVDEIIEFETEVNGFSFNCKDIGGDALVFGVFITDTEDRDYINKLRNVDEDKVENVYREGVDRFYKVVQERRKRNLETLEEDTDEDEGMVEDLKKEIQVYDELLNLMDSKPYFYEVQLVD